MDIVHTIAINAPAEFIFEQLSDVAVISTNLPSNVILRAKTDHSRFEEDSEWIIRAQRTGREFVLNTKITNVSAPKTIQFSTSSNRIESISTISISPQGNGASTVSFETRLSPKGLLGRILLQSLKASRKRVDARLETSGQKITDYFENAYKNTNV